MVSKLPTTAFTVSLTTGGGGGGGGGGGVDLTTIGDGFTSWAITTVSGCFTSTTSSTTSDCEAEPAQKVKAAITTKITGDSTVIVPTT